LDQEERNVAMGMTEHSILGLGPHGFHRLVYFEWGDPANERVVICVHGLTRRGRDFDFLARALEERYRVVCVDLPGRGQSDWLTVAADYQPSTYVQDMAALIARIGVEQVDWIGVSLGGLMGMMLAAQPKTPIRGLVLDDIGGYVGIEALQRIAANVGQDPGFADQRQLEAYMREINTGYGPLTDAQWAHLVAHGSRRDETGGWRLHYDPKLAEPFKQGFSEPVELWPLWDLISCPVLILRGSESDILTSETAVEMVVRKPGTRLVEFEGVGHAPMLMDSAQIEVVRQWLLG
jgi:pimeloyl-ACP methyl ester carboxylesterase